jgi:hypothetical protein
MSTIEGITTIMDAEKQLLADLIDFNNKYANYIQCSNSINTTNLNAEGISCSDIDRNINTVNNAYTKINDNISGDIRNVLNNFNDTTNITKQQYDDFVSNSKTLYNKRVIPLRNELDSKLMELYNTDNTLYSDYKHTYDLTIYTGIIWTILATTGLYFIFAKL